MRTFVLVMFVLAALSNDVHTRVFALNLRRVVSEDRPIFASSFNNISATDSVVTHSSHHDIDAIKYFQILKDVLGNQSRYIFDSHKADLFRHAICLSLGAKIYGGIGNMIGTIKGAQMFAFTTKRNFILNNPVIFSMFDHPDHPKQQWRVPAMDAPSFVRKQVSFSDCGSTIRHGYGTSGTLGINRCNDNIRGQAGMEIFAISTPRHGCALIILFPLQPPCSCVPVRAVRGAIMAQSTGPAQGSAAGGCITQQP